ncbi:hypothetical protein [Candidatus Palauibacter sp.]
MSRNVATPAGAPATMSAIFASSMTPGPLGMAETRPIPDAP